MFLKREKMEFILFLFWCLLPATGHGSCQDTCGVGGQDIRFPFGLTGSGCNYPGFNLTCNSLRQPTLSLPHAGNFTLRRINYLSQTVVIVDPSNCLPRRFLNSFSLSGSPFVPESYLTFAFIDCDSPTYPALPGSRPVPCLSSENRTVAALPADVYERYAPLIGDMCRAIARSVWVPVVWRAGDVETRLVWKEPDCGECEKEGGSCGFVGDPTDLRVRCSDLPSKGLSRGAKYGFAIGVGMPGLLCLIGTTCYLCGKIRDCNRSRGSNTLSNTTTASQPSIVLLGLDEPTIESYPKTQLGESRRLPNPNDHTCPICLCDYEPKETLRTIPECNHYFHVECIDKWLKLNVTCPLCRNSPENSSITTPSSSSPSSSSSSSSLSRS